VSEAETNPVVMGPESPVVKAVAEKINNAYRAAEAKDMANAVRLFDEVRNFAATPDLSDKTDKFEADFQKSIRQERDKFRSYVREGNPPAAERKIVILADSLGLPRPKEPLNVLDNMATSYAFALREGTKRLAGKVPKTSIDPLCTRYATSDTVLRDMALADLDGADVIVHVGLNDFSRRIFTERQRLSMKMLPQELVNKIVKFGQANMYRAEIIAAFPEHCYVPHDKWIANIAEIATSARKAGARSVTWLSIMQLPVSVERHTPNYRFNVLRYNLALYDAVRTGLIEMLDVDCLFRDFGREKFVHSDQMHLSLRGHLFICNRFIERLFGLAEYNFKEQ
jgi:hypothetical protein